jgi:hypothetical protein
MSQKRFVINIQHIMIEYASYIAVLDIKPDVLGIPFTVALQAPSKLLLYIFFFGSLEPGIKF